MNSTGYDEGECERCLNGRIYPVRYWNRNMATIQAWKTVCERVWPSAFLNRLDGRCEGCGLVAMNRFEVLLMLLFKLGVKPRE